MAEKKAAQETEAPQSQVHVDELAKKFNDLIGEAEKQFKVKLDEMTHKATEAKGAAEMAAQESLQEAEKKIREKPLASVAIAAGVGLLIGLLLNRRG